MRRDLAPAPLPFLSLLLLGAFAYLAFVLAMTQGSLAPVGHAERLAEVESVVDAVPLEAIEWPSTVDPDIDRPALWPLRVAPVVRSLATQYVREGPSENYDIVGLVPRDGRLDIVGRDESAKWVAITFAPGAVFHGWVPLAQVSGIADVTVLTVASLTPLSD